MKPEHFLTAINIITNNGHSSKIIINKSKPNGQVPDKNSPTIHITAVSHSVIETLSQEGFITHLDNGYLSVNYYK